MCALDTAATGMAAMDLKVQVIAGNIANMSTTGFKSQRAEFQDLIYGKCNASARKRPTRATSSRSASNSAPA